MDFGPILQKAAASPVSRSSNSGSATTSGLLGVSGLETTGGLIGKSGSETTTTRTTGLGFESKQLINQNHVIYERTRSSNNNCCLDTNTTGGQNFYTTEGQSSSPFDHQESASPLLKEHTALSSPKKAALLASGELSYLDRIAMELLETERIYVNDLDAIIQGYLNFLLSQREELSVTAIEICQLFGNIEQVFEFNRQFYLTLDTCRLDLMKMAQCFLDHEAGFDAYAEYCTQYPKMVITLNRLCQKEKVWEILKQRQKGLGHSLPLGAYLLKPIQRVLKYHLFLQNTLKHWDHCNVVEVKNIQRALDCMTGRAKHINEVKKRQEHALRVQEIQKMLLSWNTDNCQDLTQYGDLVLEGCFRLSGSKALRRLFLFEEMLLLTKDKPDGTLICKDFIMCSNLMLIESVPGDPLAFQVLSFDNPRIFHVVQARNMEQKGQWTLELKRLMLDHFSSEIPSRAKEILMKMTSTTKLPSEESDSTPSHGFKVGGGTKRQNSVPKYLEKRRKSADTAEELRVLRKKTSNNSSNSASAINMDQKRCSLPSCQPEENNCTPRNSTLSDEKRKHHILESKRQNSESKSNFVKNRFFIPQRLRRSKSPSPLCNQQQPVKIRSVTRLDGEREWKNGTNESPTGPVTSASNEHGLAKRVSSVPSTVTLGEKNSKNNLEKKYFERDYS